MEKPLFIAGILATLSVGAIAYADDNDCFVPMSQWQSRDAVRRMADEMGWTVRRIKIDDGCFEITGSDVSGHEIEAKIDPATLVVIDMEYENREHDEEEGDENDDSEARNNGGNGGPTVPSEPVKNGGLGTESKAEVIVK